MNVPTYLLAQNVHGPRFTHPPFWGSEKRTNLNITPWFRILKPYLYIIQILNICFNKMSNFD